MNGKQKKIAVVLSGGGMRCVYQVGVLEALAQKYNIQKPDIIIGSSGSAGTAAYLAAGQREAIKHIWLNLLSTCSFISFMRLTKIMNIDYLIDVIFKKEMPLNVPALKKTTIQYFIAATNNDTGRVRWFTNGDEDIIFEILRASKAIPFAYNKKIIIGGSRYIDGYIGTTFQETIEMAESAGAHIIIAIDNSLRNSFVRSLALSLYSLGNPKLQTTTRRYLRALQNKLIFTKFGAQLILIQPSRKLEIRDAFQNDKQSLSESFELGYTDAMNHPKLKMLL